MQQLSSESGSGRPRICLASTRHLRKEVFRAFLYEAEDVLIGTDDVDLVCLEAGPQLPGQEWLYKRLVHRDRLGIVRGTSSGLKKVRLEKDYDLFIAVCQFHEDIVNVNAIEGWKDRCKVSVCLLDEIWAGLIPKFSHWLEALKQFDYVFLCSSGHSMEPLGRFLGKQCHWFAGAVDAFRFSPFPSPPARVLDVYSMGRRAGGTHAVLRGLADRQEIFYFHNTHPVATSPVYDHREHRQALADFIKRSRYFLVAPAKLDAGEETRGYMDFGPRFAEGAVAGAVLLGQAPDLDRFRSAFGWQDVVIEVSPDGSDIVKAMRALDADPERFREICRRNAIEGLLRHDWVYRWAEMLRIVGLPPSQRMLDREKSLGALAAAARAGAATLPAVAK